MTSSGDEHRRARGGVLSHEEARRFYDRLGARQDWQRFFENPATRDMVRHAECSSALSVVEFGCGTGRLAEELLEHHLPARATYLGLDASTTMVGLARSRLARFGPRADVRLTDGEPRIDVAAASYDRLVSAYVLDLLSEDDIRAVVSAAHRLLRPGGLLALVSLTHGSTGLARLIEEAWMALHSWRPAAVGGCRPLSLRDFVGGPQWSGRHWRQLTTFCMTSEVLVAEKVPLGTV
jgi:ubiquinone/menaquinone biosynthesis C-methylase UbiE